MSAITNSHEDLQKLPAPTYTSPFTDKYHKDVYPAISVEGKLAGSAKGLRVLVTGGGKGVGRSIATNFAKAGATKVVITGRGVDALEATKKEIEAQTPGTKVIALAGDITDKVFNEKLFEAAGELDVLINNAGTMEERSRIHDTEPEEWLWVLDVNMKGTYLPTREFLRRNLGHPLTIINTSSTLSANTTPGFSMYYSSKSLINRFTEFLHFEYQTDDVRVFAYHPGAIATEILGSLPEHARGIFTDTLRLPAGFTLWLATQKESDFLRGKFVASNWDVDELISRKKEIEEKGLLFTRVVGFESGVKYAPSYW